MTGPNSGVETLGITFLHPAHFFVAVSKSTPFQRFIEVVVDPDFFQVPGRSGLREGVEPASSAGHQEYPLENHHAING